MSAYLFTAMIASIFLLTISMQGALSPTIVFQSFTSASNCHLELISEMVGESDVLNDIQDIVFDSSGNYLALISQNSVVIWDISQKQIKWRLPVFRGGKVAFGANSNLAIAANGSLYFWGDISNINSWIELKDEVGNPLGWVGDLTFTPMNDELIVVSGGKYRIIRYRLKDSTAVYLGEELLNDEFDSTIQALISSDGRSAAILKASDGMFFVNSETGDLLGRPDGLTTYSSHIRLLSFIQKEALSYLLINEQAESGAIYSRLLISTVSGEVIKAYDYDFEVVWTQAAFNSVNNLLVLSNATDKKLYFYDEDYEKLICIVDSLESQMVTALAFSPDGTLLASGGADGTVRLWGIPAGE